MIPEPPQPFDAEPVHLAAGTELYRVHSRNHDGNEFNPGVGALTRFAFFGEPVIPVLYAAETERAAIAETLLHDVPLSNGQLTRSAYRGRRLARLTTTRGLRLASLKGLGLRRLGVRAEQVTATTADHYADTVRWAQAAHEAGFDGIVYMSRQCNSDQAFMFFGDRATGALDTDANYRWDFDDPISGQPRLIAFCTVLGVEVLLR